MVGMIRLLRPAPAPIKEEAEGDVWPLPGIGGLRITRDPIPAFDCAVPTASDYADNITALDPADNESPAEVGITRRSA
jgi:hypothetical protein